MFHITSARLFLPIFFFFFFSVRAPSNHFVCETLVLNLSCMWHLCSITQHIPHFLSSLNEARWGAEVGRKQTGATVFFVFFPRTHRLPRTSDVIRVHSPNADLIQSPCDRLLSPYLPEAFSLRKPTGADSAALAVISGNREIEGESLPPLYCARVCRIPIDVLSETGNGGHMGHPPLQCNIQRDLT